MATAEKRRAQLKRWIDERFDRKIKRFAEAIEMPQPQISEMLSGKRAFGEKVARKIEERARMVPLYLEGHSQEGAAVSELGSRIALVRQDRKLTVAEIAERLGVTSAEVEAWELGKDPGTILFLKLCKVLQVDPFVLFLRETAVPEGNPQTNNK